MARGEDAGEAIGHRGVAGDVHPGDGDLWE